MARMIPALRSSRPPTKSSISFGFGIEQQRIDREVAPPDVFLRRLRINHPIGMPAVGIADIRAKRGDFDLRGSADRRLPSR